jgi:hypothetical protein
MFLIPPVDPIYLNNISIWSTSCLSSTQLTSVSRTYLLSTDPRLNVDPSRHSPSQSHHSATLAHGAFKPSLVS